MKGYMQEDDDIMAPLNFEATDRSLAHEQMHMSPTRHEKLALPRSAPKQGSRRRKLTDQQKGNKPSQANFEGMKDLNGRLLILSVTGRLYPMLKGKW